MSSSTCLGRAEDEGGEIGVAALIVRGLRNSKLQHRNAAGEPLKEAVNCTNWPRMQLRLGPVDTQEQPLVNTQNVLEKN